MAKLVGVFISSAYRRAIAAVVWLCVFVLILAGVGAYAVHKTAGLAQMEGDRAIEQRTRLHGNLGEAFALLHEQVTAAPCSALYREQVARVAYLPDGLNQFLHAPGGKVLCSLAAEEFAEPVDLGPPDVSGVDETGVSLWLDRDLGFLGLPGETGTLALSDPFLIAAPVQDVDLHPVHWLSMQLVLRGADGRWLHRAGEEGLYERWAEAPGLSGVAGGRIVTRSCDSGGVHCVLAEARLARVLGAARVELVMVLLAAAFAAACAANCAGRLIRRYWSFEARFRRHLDAGSVVCAYQPVMRLASGEISGCEVLARWRDIDDTIVFPDRFVEIVKRSGLTMRLTELVADRAFEELSAAVPEGRILCVSFNIFPQDLDAARLLPLFSRFTARPDRFELILEIIESDEMPAHARHEIEALRRAGIRTYIDDFGAGYSNMQNLAGLPVDGVKLDRSFAMAPDNSLMAQMLHHAIEMVEATGRSLVIEGVETAERLALLRAMKAQIDFVQGYFIARPLDIAGFAAFLAQNPLHGGATAPALQQRLRDHIQSGKIAV
jgi:sensor c-di-GMP phosphodiesterase-like protein